MAVNLAMMTMSEDRKEKNCKYTTFTKYIGQE